MMRIKHDVSLVIHMLSTFILWMHALSSIGLYD